MSTTCHFTQLQSLSPGLVPLERPYKFFFIEFIGVTLVNKIIQVSGAQFHNASCVQCIVFNPPSQVSFHHHLLTYNFKATVPTFLFFEEPYMR